MKKLAIIGASYLQMPLVLKAKEMGLETFCFAWAEGAVCKNVADHFYDISIVEKEQILTICKAERIDGICTIASDVAAPTVAYVAENLHLVGNSYQSAVTAQNKYLMRKEFAKAGVPSPRFCKVSSLQDCPKDWDFPLIVKPTDRSGSLGVQKVNTQAELGEAVQLAVNHSFEHCAVVEQYIEGREISVEFISYNGKHYPLAITDKVTTGAPHFVELAHHQPSNLPQNIQNRVNEITQQALTALNIQYGASHTEYKITEQGDIYIIELGARMGGDFIGSDLVQLSTGYDFVRGVIEVALGEFTKPIKPLQKYAGVYFLCKETEQLLPYFTQDNWIRKELTNNDLRSISCSSDRSGYFIYQADERVNICEYGGG